ATAIALALQGSVTARPMTHDLMKNVLEELGVNIERIVITELKEGTFYAIIEMSQNGTRYEISSRPSDAIALAVRVNVPIFANEEVLSEASISIRDLVQLRVIKKLLDTGVSLQKVRRAVIYLRDHMGTQPSSITLASDGTRIYACQSEDEIIDLVKRGQGVFAIALDKVWDELT